MLIDFVTDENAKLWQGISYTLLMFCTSQLKSLMNTYYIIVVYRVGVKCQTVLTAATYKKTGASRPTISLLSEDDAI
ncbi:CRE-MRP-7 protein [Ditylenchus destructor]|uniref:CRE-MRP-7 protein n=1 Tax=Ditylenchus destructor TaxID=166010 RepID=A0AAD4MU50_9BILA|nr:CRE-MRP-7 protein [Ditylenchus destructor]